MKAMIFAAGLGTRLRPLTNSKPKALVELNGKPLLQHNIEYLISFGVKDIIVNVHHFHEMIIDFLKVNNNFGVNIQISDESKKLLDTGGGLKKAAWFFDNGKPFILYNTDIISDTNINNVYNIHLQSKAIATLFVRERESSRYLLFDNSNKLCGWENVKTDEKIISRKSSELHRLAFSGIHIINPKIFGYFPDDDKFSIIDFYLHVSEKENVVGFDRSDDTWFDVGSEKKLNEAEKFLQK